MSRDSNPQGAKGNDWLLPGQGQANAIVSKPGDKSRQSVKSWREGLLPALVSYRGSCVGEGSLHKHRVC